MTTYHPSPEKMDILTNEREKMELDKQIKYQKSVAYLAYHSKRFIKFMAFEMEKCATKFSETYVRTGGFPEKCEFYFTSDRKRYPEVEVAIDQHENVLEKELISYKWQDNCFGDSPYWEQPYQQGYEYKITVKDLY